MAEPWHGNFRSCCRLCLNDNRHHLRPIFDGSVKEKDLPPRILQFVSVKVCRSDKLSTLLCRDCTRRLDAWSIYHQSCVINQAKLSDWMNKSSEQELLEQSINIKSEPLDIVDTVVQLDERNEIEHQQIYIKDEPLDHDIEEQEDYPPQLLPFQIMEEHFSEDSQGTLISQESLPRTDAYVNDATFCSLCNKSFSNPANKRRHDTYLHNKEKTPMQRSQISEIPKSITPDRKARKPFPTVTMEENGQVEEEITEKGQESEETVIRETPESQENSEETSLNKSMEKKAEEINENTINDEPDEQKMQFVAGLKLIRKDSPTPINAIINTENISSNLSKIEISYLEKCKAMVNMYNTLECACHNVQHANLRGLLSHLRALRIWFPLFTCYHCMISFTDRQTYSRHTVRCPKNQLTTLIKLSNLKERSEIKRRLYQNFKCNRCSYLYTFYEEFCHHVNEEHSTGEPPFFCTTCRTRFDDVESYRTHVYNQCMISYYCDICFITTETLDDFDKHATENHDNSEGFVLLQDDNYIKVKRDKPVVVATPRIDPAIADEHAVQVSGKRERRQSVRNPNMIPHPESDDDAQNQAPPSKVLKISPTRGPTKCPVCEKEYSNSFNMIRHYKKAHPDLVNQMNLNNGGKISDTAETATEQLPDQSYYSCPDCGGVYDSANWSQHVKSHPLEQCGDCSKTFQFKTELEQHRSVHLNLKICRDSKTLSYKSTMLSPEDEEDMHMCDICEQIFTSEEDLDNHKVSHINQDEENEEIDPESLEDIDFPPMLPVSTELLEENIKEDTKNVKEKFVCDICNREYGSWKSLREHTRVKHPEHHISRKSDYPKQCEFCEKVCMTGASMALHKQMHERMISELQQKGGAKSNKKSSGNEQDDESYHTCRFCFKVFSSKYSLKEHLKCHGVKHQKKTKPTSSKKHACDSCDEFFESSDELTLHKQEAHNEESENSDEMPILTNELELDSKIPVNVYTCDTCVLTFPSKTAMKKHKETHKNQNQVVQKTKNTAVYCKYCRIAFDSDAELSSHMMTEHEVKARGKKSKADDKVFKCPTCKKGFSSLAAMNAHAGWHKRGMAKYPPPPATTPQQTAAVKQEKQLKAAKKVAVAAASKASGNLEVQFPEYQCSTCLLELPNETALRIHVLEKHGNVSEVMLIPRCNTCNQDFYSHQEYEKHQRFHDFLERQKRHEVEITQQRQVAGATAPGQKPRHPCKHCKSEFSRSDTLTAHMKQKHPQHLETLFKCSQCDRTFDKQNSLSIHLKVHEKQKVNLPSLGTGKFACSICNMKFSLPKELRDHTITAHPF